MEDDQYELLDLLLAESARPVTFIAMFDRDDIPEAVRDTLLKAGPLIKRGARPQTSPLPLTREVNMRNPFSFAPFPSWGRVFADQSKAAQTAAYSDRAFRDQFREDLKQPLTFGNWSRVRVHEVRSTALKIFEGQTIADIAKAQGKDGVDTFLDLTLQDDLEIEFTLSTFNHRVDRMKEILANPDILIGLGDGGAHVDMLCDSGYPTYLLGTWVREHQVLTLEQGVRRLTSDPNAVRLSAFALSLSKGAWASTSSARTANRTVLRPIRQIFTAFEIAGGSNPALLPTLRFLIQAP